MTAPTPCGTITERDDGYWVTVPAYRTEGEIYTEIGPWMWEKDTSKARREAWKEARDAFRDLVRSVKQWEKGYAKLDENVWYKKRLLNTGDKA